jgi:predicted permease
MLRRLAGLFSRRRTDREFAQEIEGHLELLRERFMRQGMSAADAARAARRQFGGVTQLRETRRERMGFPRAEHWLQDVAYGLRALLRSPGFTAVAVLSLALGIGANTAIFSVIHAVLLRALPVSNPERLTVVTIPFVKRGGITFSQSFSYPEYRHLRDRSRAAEGVISFRTHPLSISLEGTTERVSGALVSGNYFQVLGVRPALGTAVEPEDDVKPGSGGARGPVAVLSYRFWQRRMNGDPAAVGRTMDVNGHPFTIVGIAPEGFAGTEMGEEPDVFAPMMMQAVLTPENANALEQRRNVWLRIMARLKPETDARQGEAELTLLHQQFVQEDLGRMKGASDARRRALQEQRIVLLPGATGISGLRKQMGTLLVILMVVVGVVLLIACANVANLSLARAAARQSEIAVRQALGASRGRLVSLVLTESMLMAGAGTALGVLLARWMRDLLVRVLIPAETLEAPLHGRVLAVAAAMGLAAGIGCGLVPAMRSSRTIWGKVPGLARSRLGAALVVAQVALSVLLLIGAGLFLRTLANLRSVDPGFRRQNILLVSTDPPLNGYSAVRSRVFYRSLLGAARGLPGVRSAGLSDSSPLANHTFWDFYVPGWTRAEMPSAQATQISPGYFDTMNIRLLLGRDLAEQDLDWAAPKVVIVNESFARQYFPDESAVGKRLGITRGESNIEIVGVVQDSKYQGLREAVQPMLYLPFAQNRLFDPMILHVRTAGNPAPVVAVVREEVRRLDPNLPVYNVHTVEEQIDRTLTGENLMATVATLFALLALALSTTGVYGVMAYAVNRRTREVGIRMAVGATPGSILRLVLRDAALLVSIGAVVGVPVAYALARLAASRFYGVGAGDAVSIAAAVGLLSTAGFAAAWIPARRAAQVDPISALRNE